MERMDVLSRLALLPRELFVNPHDGSLTETGEGLDALVRAVIQDEFNAMPSHLATSDFVGRIGELSRQALRRPKKPSK